MDALFADNFHILTIASQNWLITEKIFSRNLHVFGTFLEELKEGYECSHCHQAKSNIIYIMDHSSHIGLINQKVVNTINNDARSLTHLNRMCFNDKISITSEICIETTELNNS